MFDSEGTNWIVLALHAHSTTQGVKWKVLDAQVLTLLILEGDVFILLFLSDYSDYSQWQSQEPWTWSNQTLLHSIYQRWIYAEDIRKHPPGYGGNLKQNGDHIHPFYFGPLYF